MKKIPTVFKRDPDNMAHVISEVNPGCEWVLVGEGIATRKYDGTCVMYDGEYWWARREVKLGKPEPENFQAVNFDEITGKTVGWEPIGNSSFNKFWSEAQSSQNSWMSGTYELCGPKINGNPEDLPYHVLINHATAQEINLPFKLDSYKLIRQMALELKRTNIEGIVWHHPDGRMAKIKGRDFM